MQVGLKLIFFLLAFAYCVIKVFFANIKRGGILLIQISVGSLYLFSVPRGYTDGFYQWCKGFIQPLNQSVPDGVYDILANVLESAAQGISQTRQDIA